MGRGGRGGYSRYGAPIDTSIPNSRAKNGVFNTLLDFGAGAASSPGGLITKLLGGFGGVRSGRGVRNQLAREYAVDALQRAAMADVAQKMGIDSQYSGYMDQNNLNAIYAATQDRSTNEDVNQFKNTGDFSPSPYSDPSISRQMAQSRLDQMGKLNTSNFLVNGGGATINAQGQAMQPAPGGYFDPEALKAQTEMLRQPGGYQNTAYSQQGQGNPFDQPVLSPSDWNTIYRGGQSAQEAAYRMGETNRHNTVTEGQGQRRLDQQEDQNNWMNGYRERSLQFRADAQKERTTATNEYKQLAKQQSAATAQLNTAQKTAKLSGLMNKQGQLVDYDESWPQAKKDKYDNIRRQIDDANDTISSLNQRLNSSRVLLETAPQIQAPDVDAMIDYYQNEKWGF